MTPGGSAGRRRELPGPPALREFEQKARKQAEETLRLREQEAGLEVLQAELDSQQNRFESCSTTWERP